MLERSFAFFLTSALLAATSLLPLSTDAPSGDREGSTTGLATIRKVVEEVHVTFTVEDRHHRPVKHVQSGDIVLLEDGKPVSAITGFRQNSDLPLRLALV